MQIDHDHELMRSRIRIEITYTRAICRDRHGHDQIRIQTRIQFDMYNINWMKIKSAAVHELCMLNSVHDCEMISLNWKNVNGARGRETKVDHESRSEEWERQLHTMSRKPETRRMP